MVYYEVGLWNQDSVWRPLFQIFFVSNGAGSSTCPAEAHLVSWPALCSGTKRGFGQDIHVRIKPLTVVNESLSGNGHRSRVVAVLLVCCSKLAESRVEIRCRVWCGLGAALDHSPDALPDGLIWRTAQGHPWATPNCRKCTPKRTYHFWRTFCKECACIASSPIRTGSRTIRACSRPCNHPSVLWTSRTDCAVLQGRGVRMAGSSGPRVVNFRLL